MAQDKLIQIMKKSSKIIVYVIQNWLRNRETIEFDGFSLQEVFLQRAVMRHI